MCHVRHVCMRAMYVYSAHSTRAPTRKNCMEACDYSKISLQKPHNGGREAPPSPAGGGACVVFWIDTLEWSWASVQFLRVGARVLCALYTCIARMHT